MVNKDFAKFKISVLGGGLLSWAGWTPGYFFLSVQCIFSAGFCPGAFLVGGYVRSPWKKAKV